MKWYLDRLRNATEISPVLSACGDDCAVCPRYLAKTEEELREVAGFWYRAGWRDRVLPPDEMSCSGCGTRNVCTFQLLSCQREHETEKCSACPEFECERVRDTYARSGLKKEQCRQACENEQEFALLCRAFYEKEKNMRL